MFVPGCRKDKFIRSLPDGWSPSPEEAQEMRNTVKDLWAVFDNKFQTLDSNIPWKSLDIITCKVVHRRISELLGMNHEMYPTNLDAFFSSPASDPMLQKLLVGLHNAKVYAERYMETMVDSHINFNYISRNVLSKAASPFLKTSTQKMTDWVFLRIKAGMAFAFALNNNVYVPLLVYGLQNPHIQHLTKLNS